MPKESKELIITEKPSAALKLAEALADGKIEHKHVHGVNYFSVKHNKKEITIVSAVGHLFTVTEKKKSFKYPSFDLEWKATYEDNKEAMYSKKYADVIAAEGKKADSFVVACDYDIEGEVIGLNAIRFLCHQKDAKRMKFSTLTKPDLIEAYDNMSKTLDWGQARAGETRHFLDWMYGINLSRALTLAIRKKKAYRTMSSGRVQGPSLKLLADREKEIKAFVPVKYWQIDYVGANKSGEIEAWHEKDKFWDQKEADKVIKNTKGHDGKISSVDKSESKHLPPFPFDLTTLQTEAYAVFGFTPSRTLEYAQSLYVKGYISYPRTSSQQLPDKISYKKIVQELMQQPHYVKIGNILLSKKSLVPNNGKKTDPAHPAIYPTGQAPSGIQQPAAKVYDLIVKRFFATFGDAATRQTMTIQIDVNSENFIAKGTRTTDKGWHVLYEPYLKLKDEELPAVKEGEQLKTKKITKEEKETQPPKRFTEASLIKELESRNLGTKATRAQIIENLYSRQYIEGKAIEVTFLGLKTAETLEKYCSEIVDEELTRSFEDDMDGIRENKTTPEKVLEKAKKELIKTLEHFKKNEAKIGEELVESYRETEREKTFIGACPVCKVGELHILMNRKNHSRFIACNKYPDCKTTFPLPKGNILSTTQACEKCGYPMIEIRTGKIPKKLCINIACTSKESQGELKKDEKEIIKNLVEQECPKCKEGKLVVRKSMYGHFLACDKFPKCRYTQPIKDMPLKEDFKKEK